jgi:hypothetical protein
MFVRQLAKYTDRRNCHKCSVENIGVLVLMLIGKTQPHLQQRLKKE